MKEVGRPEQITLTHTVEGFCISGYKKSRVDRKRCYHVHSKIRTGGSAQADIKQTIDTCTEVEHHHQCRLTQGPLICQGLKKGAFRKGLCVCICTNGGETSSHEKQKAVLKIERPIYLGTLDFASNANWDSQG